jgi:hypothetical protein
MKSETFLESQISFTRIVLYSIIYPEGIEPEEVGCLSFTKRLITNDEVIAKNCPKAFAPRRGWDHAHEVLCVA